VSAKHAATAQNSDVLSIYSLAGLYDGYVMLTLNATIFRSLTAATLSRNFEPHLSRNEPQ
jgi:hypothetical protein